MISSDLIAVDYGIVQKTPDDLTVYPIKIVTPALFRMTIRRYMSLKKCQKKSIAANPKRVIWL